MKDRYIVITGCSGRIGSALAKRLGVKWKVIGLDRHKPLVFAPHQEFISVEFSSETQIHDAFEHIRKKFGTKLAAVVHLAAYYSFTGAHPELYEIVTLGGTKNVLKQLQNFEVEQFIFSSTMLVHAPCLPSETINEKSPIQPKWDYPLSKVKTEKLIRSPSNKIPSLILRIAGVYDDYCHSIPLSNQIERIFEGKLESHFFPGDLTHGASYIHMEDLIDLIESALEKRPLNETLLVGEAKTLSYETLQQKISTLLFRKEISTYRIPKWFAKAGSWLQNTLPFMPKTFIKPWMIDIADDNYTLDVRKAERILDWIPRRSLQETLPKMIDALQENKELWYQAHILKH